MARRNKSGVGLAHGLSGHQRWTLAISCAAVALVIASMAALYSAMADIAIETHATQSQLTWIIDGYTLALACLVLPAGAIGDRYGRRVVLIVGLGVFTLASAAPLLFSSPEALIVSRIVAGVGAAFVMPSTLSLLTTQLDESHRGKAVGIWAGVAGSGGIIGIMGSGVILDFSSWYGIFVGLTVAGALLFIGSLTVSESRDLDPFRIDVTGTVLSASAVGLAVYAITESSHTGWSDGAVIWPLAVAAVCAVAFVVVELRTEHPLLDVRLFLDRVFGAGAFALTVQFLVSFGMFLMVIQFMQLIMGYGPLTSSLIMGPMCLPVIVVSLLSPRLTVLLGLRFMLVAGFVLIAAGFFAMSHLSVDSAYWEVLWPNALITTGLGLCTAPATNAIMSSTPVEKQGVAAAVNDATRELGAAIGIAIAGSVLAAGYSSRIDGILGQLPESARGPVSESLAAALQVADRSGPSGASLADYAKQAFLHGTHNASITLGALTAVAAVVLLFIAPGRVREESSSDASVAPAVESSASRR